MEAKDAEIARQQRELQALRVRTYCCKVWFCSRSSTCKSSEVDIFYKFMLWSFMLSKLSHLQQQAQEKDVEAHRQQRELQALRVRTCCYKVWFAVVTPARVCKWYKFMLWVNCLTSMHAATGPGERCWSSERAASTASKELSITARVWFVW